MTFKEWCAEENHTEDDVMYFGDIYRAWHFATIEATLAERERCAKVCEELENPWVGAGHKLSGEDYSEAIRKGE